MILIEPRGRSLGYVAGRSRRCRERTATGRAKQRPRIPRPGPPRGASPYRLMGAPFSGRRGVLIFPRVCCTGGATVLRSLSGSARCRRARGSFFTGRTMSITLTTHRGRPALSIADHKGREWHYLYAVSATPAVWSVRLTAIDPETGEPACDRQGRERSYAVTFSGLGECCQCPDFTYRKRPAKEPCKHLQVARELRSVLAAITGVTT